MPEKLVSLKIDRSEREKRYADAVIAPDAAEYPWGLSITLDNETLEKLGIDKLPKVEASVTLEARAKVTSVSSNESTHSGKSRSVSLQITHLCLESGRKSAADVLYGKE